MLGELPEWVAFFAASKTVGVPPWELAGFTYKPETLPICWINWALLYERVDIEARHQLRREAEAQIRQRQALGGT